VGWAHGRGFLAIGSSLGGELTSLLRGVARLPRRARPPQPRHSTTELRCDHQRLPMLVQPADATRRRGPTGHRPSGPASNRRQHCWAARRSLNETAALPGPLPNRTVVEDVVSSFPQTIWLPPIYKQVFDIYRLCVDFAGDVAPLRRRIPGNFDIFHCRDQPDRGRWPTRAQDKHAARPRQ